MADGSSSSSFAEALARGVYGRESWDYDPVYDVVLTVNCRRYNGWKSVRVTRSIESLAGSFALDVTDRWGGQDELWPIVEEDECRVEIAGVTVIRGFIDKRSLSLSSGARLLSYTGRDRSAALVDNSLIVEGASVKGNKWTYRNIDVAAFTREIADRFDIDVAVQPGLVLRKDPLLVAHPGETGFEAIKRATGAAGVMVVSDGKGGITITRAGTDRAAPLVEGYNVLAAQVEYDGADRFHRYLIASQVPGTDEASGDATRVQAEAVDMGVRRTERVLVIRPEKSYNAAEAKRRADWEARIRAAKAEPVTISVQGWKQPNSPLLWAVNTRTHVEVPSIGVKRDMLISQVEYSISESGRITQLRLVRPDAFLPEPQAVVAGSGEGAWKELAKGAL